ncbi:YdcF family protein [Diaphorobacter sp. HDW4A]|uniref:YdcF family protein n=1 Tax=Diaphorobacter sp. HDW4A TaxID=2714924 RepID=UPI00140CA75C|nr:YdcF family protein [Diaphorobacter sp. HDW4A]QIL79897.1 YdcF family protein [Diaphorobacter sp. HDW4A]
MTDNGRLAHFVPRTVSLNPSSITIPTILRPLWLRVLCGVVGVLLLGDALVLMMYGMFNVGILVPAAIGVVLLTMLIWREPISRTLAARPRLRRLWRLGWWLFAIWVVSLLVFWLRIAQQMHGDGEPRPVDAIIVLGSATRDGQPSQTLALRLDTAAEVAMKEPGALIATSGGVDFGETDSEGRIMARYLQQRHGIAVDRFVMEEQSTSTALNLSLSMALLAAQKLPADASIAIVTSDFHTPRAQWIANKVGIRNAHTVAAPTPLSIRFNAWLREYFAVASSWLLREF